MITSNEKTLRTPNKDVDINEAKTIIQKLEYELRSSTNIGVGLAAPQIGINKRVAIIRIEKPYKQYVDLVNPTMVHMKYGFVNHKEGCLSVPNKLFNTWRYKEILIKDLLRPSGLVATDYDALVIQHEYDHLESILIMDRAISSKIGRNDPCPCGAMKNNKPTKYKKCCGI